MAMTPEQKKARDEKHLRALFLADKISDRTATEQEIEEAVAMERKAGSVAWAACIRLALMQINRFNGGR